MLRQNKEFRDLIAALFHYSKSIRTNDVIFFLSVFFLSFFLCLSLCLSLSLKIIYKKHNVFKNQIKQFLTVNG